MRRLLVCAVAVVYVRWGLRLLCFRRAGGPHSDGHGTLRRYPSAGTLSHSADPGTPRPSRETRPLPPDRTTTQPETRPHHNITITHKPARRHPQSPPHWTPPRQHGTHHAAPSPTARTSVPLAHKMETQPTPTCPPAHRPAGWVSGCSVVWLSVWRVAGFWGLVDRSCRVPVQLSAVSCHRRPVTAVTAVTAGVGVSRRPLSRHAECRHAECAGPRNRTMRREPGGPLSPHRTALRRGTARLQSRPPPVSPASGPARLRLRRPPTPPASGPVGLSRPVGFSGPGGSFCARAGPGEGSLSVIPPGSRGVWGWGCGGAGSVGAVLRPSLLCQTA